ncbi:hypothetical protein AN641_00995 [Candidatus Epulonipiscioides gigas]|nr:hypothetical protein AN641_00995 [Epulopiscium sp. SCG-C07WGA-EpuloA2]
MVKELCWTQLKDLFQPSDFYFETIEQISGSDTFLGQDEAINALNFALNLNNYNIFIASEESFLDEIIKIIEEKALFLNVPEDLCYVYNFEEPNKPKILYLEAGDGKILQDDLKEFVIFLKNELSERLKSLKLEDKKQELIKDFEEQKNEILEKLNQEVKELGFNISQVEGGLAFSIIDENNIINLEENSNKIKQLARIALDQINIWEQEIGAILNNLYEEELIRQISGPIHILKIKYKYYTEFIDYFDNIFEDILEHSDLFIENEDENTEVLKGIFPIMNKSNLSEFLKRYEVNLIVNNSNKKGAPVIVAQDSDYRSLMGSITLKDTVDISSIKAGALQQARGGFLILKAEDIIERLGGWQAIKQTLNSGFIKMEDLKNDSINVPQILEPEKIKANVRIILVGSSVHYDLLKNYEPSFSKLFKFRIDFLDEANYTKEIIEQIGYVINKQCKKEKLKPVTTQALLNAIRKTQYRIDKISLNVEPIYKLIYQANSIAKDKITEVDIENVDKFNKTLLNKINNDMKENYKLNRTLIDVDGSKIGEINGLCIYDIGENTIGHPIKITATSYKGKKGIINIEKAAGISGSIHSKGVEIIEGFLGGRFAKTIEPSLNCKICIEQNYASIDGDSASSAELYAVISSLCGIPLKQNLAVTGSINQYGDIQPVGGLSEKIEGFFKACQQKGLTNDQGVIIPYQNQVDLILTNEIIEHIQEGKFHIYPIKRYEQGIELLTGESARRVEEKVRQVLKLMVIK